MARRDDDMNRQGNRYGRQSRPRRFALGCAVVAILFLAGFMILNVIGLTIGMFAVPPHAALALYAGLGME